MILYTIDATVMPQLLIPVTIGIVTLGTLLYIAIEDTRSMSVSTKLSFGLLILHILTNLLLVIIYSNDTKFTLSDTITYYPFLNLVMGIILGAATSLVVFLTKERGMGWGDVVFIALIGLICGFPKTITALYIAIFSALLYGIVMAVKHGKFGGMRIPFIPFIVIGITAGFLLGDETIDSIVQTLSSLF